MQGNTTTGAISPAVDNVAPHGLAVVRNGPKPVETQRATDRVRADAYAVLSTVAPVSPLVLTDEYRRAARAVMGDESEAAAYAANVTRRDARRAAAAAIVEADETDRRDEYDDSVTYESVTHSCAPRRVPLSGADRYAARDIDKRQHYRDVSPVGLLSLLYAQRRICRAQFRDCVARLSRGASLPSAIVRRMSCAARQKAHTSKNSIAALNRRDLAPKRERIAVVRDSVSYCVLVRPMRSRYVAGGFYWKEAQNAYTQRVAEQFAALLHAQNRYMLASDVDTIVASVVVSEIVRHYGVTVGPWARTA